MSSENNASSSLPQIDILVALGIAMLTFVAGLVTGVFTGHDNLDQSLLRTSDGFTREQYTDTVKEDWKGRHDSQQRQLCATLAGDPEAVKLLSLDSFDYDYIKAAWSLETLAVLCEDVDF